jgi:preprotein translocase subunit SecA
VVRNPIGLRERLARMRGTPIEFELSIYDAALAAVERAAANALPLDDSDLTARSRDLQSQARAGASLDALLPGAFALAGDAARRTLGLRPFPVQIVAALALHAGRVVEMQTGEGKTLAAVMPAYLNALTGRGVHVLTFNDYLARRDAEWMGPIYRLLGVTVAFVQAGMSSDGRRSAYAADITYVTAKEAGFDHLRDLLATEPDELVHRRFHMAIVDEADSLLIDEGRVPLVIAGRVEDRISAAKDLARIVADLEPIADFSTDEYARNVELTDAGLARVEAALGRGSLHTDANIGLLTEVNCALHARVLLTRDVDYLVRDGRIELVDEFTGRVVEDRHWPDGLQAALEMKEGLARQSDGHILGTITLQHFLSGYPRLCGMTGTAQPAANEFAEFYGMRTAILPTHRPMIRVDHPDLVFTHRAAKEQAVVNEVRRAHAIRRPVLVGTLTVEDSERLAARLEQEGIACAVLNARNDADEADIIARAGALGAITISTNMAGRGTDIRLGGPNEAEREHVLALGGLYVIGTNKHESRRIDQQLRGRAGRQGDPGDSRFFVALDDPLLVRYGLRTLVPARFWPSPQEAPIEVAVVSREIARAQRIVEGQDLEIRRTLWKYARPIEDQRCLVHARRQALLMREAEPDVWRREERFRELITAVGKDVVRDAERRVTLAAIDRAWREQLAFVADVREGVHLERLGGNDPLSRFNVLVAKRFNTFEDSVEDAVAAALAEVQIRDGDVDLSRTDIKGPSATWTYLVNDDPFRRQLGMQLTGPGGVTFAIGAAVLTMPLLLLMGVVDRLWKRHPPKRGLPH